MLHLHIIIEGTEIELKIPTMTTETISSTIVNPATLNLKLRLLVNKLWVYFILDCNKSEHLDTDQQPAVFLHLHLSSSRAIWMYLK